MTTTKKILSCVTPGAIEYLQKTVNSSNRVDYQRLKKLFDNKYFEAKSFDDTNLDILTFDWQSLERDRNWWWQLQALPFLNWYANSLAVQSEKEKSHYFSLCLDAINNWVRRAKLNEDSPLAWHDHAAAFRVRNLTNWLVFCHLAGLSVVQNVHAQAFGNLIIEHLDWLQEDEHYSQHTNHGFDQAMSALIITSMFAGDDFETYRQCNRERLKNEINFAFTNEGVHKENSPGYQKFMLGRLKQLRDFYPLGEKEISQMGERYIEKAEAFLRAITLPNGYLPMIGDTRGWDKGLPYEQKEQIDVLDYSASGYIIVRGVVLEKDFHLVFKASHFSHYHRHDDDLSIHLYFGGKILLEDAGLGSHDERDRRRISLRSSLSHNAPYIEGRIAVRKIKELDGKLPEIIVSDKKILGISFCYGVKITRELDFSCLEKGIICLKDTCYDKAMEDSFVVNFFSSEYFHADKNSIYLKFDDGYLFKIKSDSFVTIKERDSFVSNIYSVFSKACSFSFQSKEHGHINKIDTTLNLNGSSITSDSILPNRENGFPGIVDYSIDSVFHRATHYKNLAYIKYKDISHCIIENTRSDKLFVSFHGSIKPISATDSGTPLPCFRLFDLSIENQPYVLCFSDILLDFYKDKGVCLGWFLDSNKLRQRDLIQEIVEYYVAKYSIKEVLFHGSSGGGHIAVDLAARTGQVALVSNCQFILNKHQQFEELNNELMINDDQLMPYDLESILHKERVFKIISYSNTDDYTYEHHKYLENIVENKTSGLIESYYFGGDIYAKKKSIRNHDIGYPEGMHIRDVLRNYYMNN